MYNLFSNRIPKRSTISCFSKIIAIFCIFLPSCAESSSDYNGFYRNPSSTSYVNPYDIPRSPYPDQDQYYQPPLIVDNSDQLPDGNPSSSIWNYK